MIKRITKKDPITGNIRTKIYKITWFKKKLLYDYGFELIMCRTIGVRESQFGLPSVMTEYGELLGFQYFYKNYLKNI